jgi:hypothetical protein
MSFTLLPRKIFSCIHFTKAEIGLKTACVCTIPVNVMSCALGREFAAKIRSRSNTSIFMWSILVTVACNLIGNKLSLCVL